MNDVPGAHARPAALSTNKARGGVTGHHVRYVLGFGLCGHYCRFHYRGRLVWIRLLTHAGLSTHHAQCGVMAVRPHLRENQWFGTCLAKGQTPLQHRYWTPVGR